LIWKLNGEISNGCSADIPIQKRVAMSMGFGWAFLFFGVGALSISLCCASCSRGDRSSGYITYPGGANTASSTPYFKAEGDIESPSKQQKRTQSQKQRNEEIPVAQAVLY
jgi:hypothetical protein